MFTIRLTKKIIVFRLFQPLLHLNIPLRQKLFQFIFFGLRFHANFWPLRLFIVSCKILHNSVKRESTDKVSFLNFIKTAESALNSSKPAGISHHSSHTSSLMGILLCVIESIYTWISLSPIVAKTIESIDKIMGFLSEKPHTVHQIVCATKLHTNTVNHCIEIIEKIQNSPKLIREMKKSRVLFTKK